MLITGAQLRKIFLTLTPQRSEEIASAVNSVCPQYGITKAELPAFLAQVGKESGEFRSKVESLNYSASALVNTFSFYRDNPALAQLHGRTDKHPARQELIARTVYWDKNRAANRKLGNITQEDAALYIGRSFIQITGKNMYIAYAKYKKVPMDTVVNMIGSSDLWAMDAAAFVFAVEKKLLDEAKAGKIDAVSRAIAGSDIGLEDRRKYYNRAVAVLK